MLSAVHPNHLCSFVPESLSGAVVLMLWVPDGCDQEITTILAPSLIVCQMGVALMLKPPSSVTPLQEGVKGTLSLPLSPRTPLPSSSQVTFMVLLVPSPAPGNLV